MKVLASLFICLLFTCQSFAAIENKANSLKVERLLRVMKAEKLQNEVINQILTTQLQLNPQIKDYQDILADFYDQTAGWKAIKNDIINIYAQNYSDQEIEELADFYGTAVGQKVLQRTPHITAQIMNIANVKIAQNKDTLVSRIKERTEKLKAQQKK